MEIVILIIVGAAAGWLGSVIYTGRGLGIFGNIIIGIIGSFIGYWFLGELGISLGTGIIGAILTGAIGAIIVLFLIHLIARLR